MKAIFRFVRLVSQFAMALGGILSLISGLMFPLLKSRFGWTEADIRDAGLTILILGIVITTIASVIIEYLEGLNQPKLVLRDFTIEPKEVSTSNGQLIGNFDFVFGIIENLPKNLDNDRSAEYANIEISFKSRDREPVHIKYARWCDSENPLFPTGTVDDMRALKTININPRNPESFVLAYRQNPGTNIYAFFFSDHRQFRPDTIKELTTKRFVGEPPIDVTITIRGKFPDVEFRRVLDVNKANQMVVYERDSRNS